MIKLLSSIKHVAKSSPFILLKNRNGNSCSYSCLFIPPSAIDSPSVHHLNLSAKDVVASLKDWFKAPNTSLLDRIFSILISQDQAARDDESSRHAADLALSHLNLPLSETFVLQVLSYGRSSSKDVLSCLKFFDWAGRQPGFHHTRATFHAIFKILSKAKLVPLMLEFLQDFMKHRCSYRVRFHDTLVLGYALAGKPAMALQMFGRMRFQGLDLDTFAYHVLLNALVDESCFDAVDMIAKQISLRGFDNGITHCILVKCWCKQSKLEEAEAYLRGLAESRKPVDGHAVSIIVSALCKGNRFQHAATLLEEFTELNVPMEQAYGIWLQNVVQRGKLNWYLNFINRKKLFSRNVPRLFQYNVLVLRLLREYRLNDVFDLLIEMENDGISPDKVTMNAVLCFFCKAGMVDVAIELYNSRSEFGLSLNRMTYCDFISNLCWNGVIDEAYCVLRNSVREGYFPSKKTFSILAGALCREEKFDRIKELVVSSLEQKFRPCYDVCDSFIVALCKANRVEDAYLLHGEISRINKDMSSKTYFHLIHGFCKSNRGDIAAALLLEMQEKGHKPIRKLFRYVICCLCDMQSLENQFFKLLEMQLSHFEPSSHIFNFFIAGAGHAKKPELAREVFEMMLRSGIKPSLRSDIFMLHSYLKNDRISDALNFFNDVRRRRQIGRKLYSSIVVGLCKADKVDYALNFMREMRNNNVFPGMECYEHLIQLLCWKESYSLAVSLVNELEQTRGYITSFIGNVLLSHSLKTKKLYKAWVQFREGQDETSDISLLGQLIGIFSGCMEANQDIKSFEEIIAKCFPVDVYTYNTLLRKLSESKVDLAFELYDWICEKGYEPNRWTYDIIIHCLLKKGRRAEAQRWLEEMFEKGFDLTERTKLLI
ncbi:hypothetical protein ERO13_A02G106600v2 [Gossypium hirsutum]|uniref:Pentacotripeptide-repeat region of PRORP domain-containing protein n=4 Tax=Gossypium TaxID=3633 RepID=A0A2P5WRR2_GOSBA|nr:pentatricopeptide repeat-containing protein At1g71210, mitochondrial-like [Gossypium hirsutum]KAB2093940.1 hypothetical protein ES319_A02G124200v1 [Gossypium barbadense]TYH28361.1 hypothetical protein ES288_A02G137600v1 [Gossypium darwinii]TYJ46582.1 hypothetical protein E1A91_A02G129200v1 [Gossypium mustelinum]KAG4211616.1 hypothetical protein ERO13_A02G106600v2 [Gossypium hirsutum]PPR93789.1 hypothetical protein GOBAR_AA26883 [Gossypium barbadense]